MKKKTINLVLLCLCMLTMVSCAAQRKVSGSPEHLPKDSVSVKKSIPCPESDVSIDTSNNYGSVRLNISDGELEMMFNCDQCTDALEEVYIEYYKLLQLYDDIKDKPSKIKVRNSFNTVTKNSNNSTEIYNLKKSLLQKSDSIATLTADNIKLGKENDRLKNASKGDGSPNTAKSGNTTQKTPWYVFLIVFICGGVFFRALPLIIKKFIPGINIASTINKIIR